MRWTSTLRQLAAVATLWRVAVGAAVVIPVVLTVLWSVDAANSKTPDANLWPIGAAFLAPGSIAGIGFVCALALAVRERRPSGRA